MKICHITSAHPTFDIRIFHKECVSLAEAGHEVMLVCTGIKEQTFVEKGVKIIQVSAKSSSRLERMLHAVNRVYKAAINENADAYHLHDPELLRLVSKFKKHKKMVIFDAHEDLPGQIMGKYYIPFALRKLFALGAKIVEKHYITKTNALFTAVEPNSIKMAHLSKKVITLNNYPLHSEFEQIQRQFSPKKTICYIGSITKIRGIQEIINALELSKAPLLLAGNFSPESFKDELSQLPGWNYVDFLGTIGRKEVSSILSNCSAGIVMFHPAPNHSDNLPTKMFEYMAAGLPIIASNFPLWKSIIEDNNCGLCVDPLNVEQIAEAITFMLTNPEKAIEMGKNGRKAFLEKYNWEAEKPKLINLYKELASSL